MKRSGQNTEGRILDAAKLVFMRDGLYGARMQDIADTAGINKALLHYYFRSKEKLFDTVFEGALHKYFEQMDVFSQDGRPLVKQLHQYVDNVIDFLREYPQMSMFIIKEVSVNTVLFRKKVMAIKKHKGIRLVQVLEEAMARKEIKKTDPVMFMINLQSLCSYPFLAAPIYRQALRSLGKEKKGLMDKELKRSIKNFIDNTLFK
jgi:TetR/AcrR family transcriptional regulator